MDSQPAPDLCRLLTHLARQAAEQAGTLRTGKVITTGSCTGMEFVGPLAQVSGQLVGYPPVTLTFAH